MTKRYPGGYITKTAPTVTTSSAPGIWTMEQQAAYQKAGTWPAQPNPQYIEEVFSTWLYTGNGSTQTITNGIDLSTYGGMVWRKQRDAAYNNIVADTVRGQYSTLFTNDAAAASGSSYIGNFSTTGFDVVNSASSNPNGSTNASWTFRKQPKFFDVVTYTGNAVSGRTVAHNLGSVPGCIIIKRTDAASDWAVMARRSGFTSNYSTGLKLNATNARTSDYDYTVGSDISSTVFPVYIDPDSGLNAYNVNGATYVAYLFAHDAGGFGAAGTDNVISCGSFTSNGSGAVSVTLSYEPQWVLYKPSSGTGDWRILDNMRGWAYTNNAALFPNGNYAEIVNTDPSTCGVPTATGFSFAGGLAASTTYIYIAIRRGPMKTPTDATKVFSPIASSATAGTQLTTNFPVDLQMYGIQAGDAANITTNDRLRGVSTTNTAGGNFIVTSSTAAETGGSYTRNWGNTGFVMPVAIGDTQGVFWNFQRAPGFFDEVCYTGTGVARTVNHNLGVAPELMIVKGRSVAEAWVVYSATLGPTKYLRLNAISASASEGGVLWNNTSPTSSVFSLGDGSGVNVSGGTYVAYLFATVAGVSKVGSYTGTGASQVINCGFTGGARFVIIKRTDSTGDWYTYDTARGMTSSTDPYLLMNSTAAETTGTDYVETSSTGFTITSTAPAAINANGGNFLFLAIA